MFFEIQLWLISQLTFLYLSFFELDKKILVIDIQTTFDFKSTANQIYSNYLMAVIDRSQYIVYLFDALYLNFVKVIFTLHIPQNYLLSDSNFLNIDNISFSSSCALSISSICLDYSRSERSI
jgi:hypothetical protein